MRPITAALASAVLLMAVNFVRADEEKVPLDKLPKAVSDTVKKRFPKAEQLEAGKETKDGKTEYEVTIKDAGKKIDVTVSPEGTLLCIEKELAIKDLPKAVADAIEGKFAKSTLKSAEEVIKVKDGKEKLEYYEVLVTTAEKKRFEVQIAADGKITNTEAKTEGED